MVCSVLSVLMLLEENYGFERGDVIRGTGFDLSGKEVSVTKVLLHGIWARRDVEAFANEVVYRSALPIISMDIQGKRPTDDGYLKICVEGFCKDGVISDVRKL